ncbi:MAG: hypothetical protein L6V93_22935 [Clostridiales bacterium]|nr:MAG: hypothetical protein L6V93_22935 [Clostridiales bacterium]
MKKRRHNDKQKNANGEFEVKDLKDGWYTFLVQTDKRDYFTLCVYVSN